MLSLDATVHILWLGTTIAACLSGVTVLTALSIDTWLKSEEKILNPSYRNGSSKVEFLGKKTISGLFTLCATEVGKSDYHCQNIDYFPKEEYSPDPNDSTMAIPHTVLKSVGFILTAVVLLTIAEVLCLGGQFCTRKRFFTFISGITFIISGLLMMLGMVIYIATLKGEVAEKLRPRSTFQPPLFVYTYGWSCYLIMFGFIATEVAGISAVFLYIYWHKRDWSKKEEQKLNSQLMETPPPCLKHQRQRSLSFHSSVEPDSLDTPMVRRSRSQQYLDGHSQDQCSISHHSSHASQNHINHQAQNHINHYNDQHNHQKYCQQTYQKPPPNSYSTHYPKDLQRSICDIESHQQPQPQSAKPFLQHQQYPSQQHQHHQDPQRYSYPQQQQQHQQQQQQHFPNTSTQQSFQWSNRSFENVPRGGRSLNELSKSDYLDEVLLSRSGTIPRSRARDYSRGSGTLPRSFPRSCDALCGQTREREGTLTRNYAKDDTALCSSFSRRGFQYPNTGQHTQCNLNTACDGQGGMCSVDMTCCNCCSCYCCCCCWQQEGSRSEFGGQGTRQAQAPTHSMPRSTPAWQQQRKYPVDHTRQLSRGISSNTISNTVDLNASSGSLHQHHHYPQQPQQQQHHFHQADMANLNYGSRANIHHQGYQTDAQRHTTPV